MKKLIPLLLALALVFTMVSAAQAEDVTLVLWSMMTDDVQAPILQAAVDRFEADHPGVTVEIVSTENDQYKTKLNVVMGSSNMPDVFHNSGGGWLKEYVDAGLVLDITDYLDQDGLRDLYYPAYLQLTRYDGRDYGVPIDANLCAFFYDAQMFADLNLEVPTTYEEFKTLCAALNDAGIIPISLANQSSWCGALFGEYIVDRIGGEQVFIKAANRTGSFADEAYIEAFRVMQEMADLNMFPMGFSGMSFDSGTSRNLLYTGKAAMQLMPSGIIPLAKAEAPEYAARLDAFVFPAIEGGTGDPSNLIGGVDSFSVTSTTAHPELACELLKYISDKNFAGDWINKAGRIAGVVGMDYGDGLNAKLVNLMETANASTIYYDQMLSPELGNYWNEITQAVFSKTMTPEEAAAAMEAKAAELAVQ